MLTSKQRAYLRGIAAKEDTILQIGKGGVGENMINQVNDALKAREIVKIRVLENSLMTADEAAAQLAESTSSEIVQTIGSKLVLFKRNPQSPVIELPKKERSSR
ncbi:MAG: YhbY family RNA-binding protein [Ruminococcus sp.]|nr:YhbY family RNA-binding protein [Ruminococcus sp.]